MKNAKLVRSGGCVSLTVYDIPVELLHEFSEYVVKPYYHGGISPAIKDLMRIGRRCVSRLVLIQKSS